MIKISTIIPLYNCGDYIIRCLDSLNSQGLSSDELQIIVINDGSTDNGPVLVTDYCLNHSNVTLYSQENMGVSEARNHGFQYAKGEYVHFCDADDYIIRGGYRKLLNISANADFVKMSSKTIGNGDDINNHDNLDSSLILYHGDAKGYVKKYGLNVAIITTLYKRDFLKKNNIRFEPCSYGEDVLFNARCYILTSSVVFTDAIVYGYYVRSSSVSRSINKVRTERIINDYIYTDNKNILLDKIILEKIFKIKVNEIMLKADIYKTNYLGEKANTQEEYNNAFEKIPIICPIHGEFWQIAGNHIYEKHGCPKCKQSKLENEIMQFLSKNKIEYETQQKFDWLDQQSLDFYLPKYNVGIECQGIQHFQEVNFFGGEEGFKETVKRDNIKRALCESHGIKLLYYSDLGIEYPYKVYEDIDEMFNDIKKLGST